MYRARRSFHLLVLIAIAWLPVGAAAQIEELIVTAQKRAQDVQDVPISVSAYSGNELEERGLNDMQQLANFVPNFAMPSSNNMRNASLQIRGIGSPGTNPGIEASVGAFLDGVYMPTGAMALGELADISTVEILRGPQGTLYGRNTPVGAINITTRRPAQDTEALLRVGGGDYRHRWVNGYVGSGLSQNVSGRVGFFYRERGGFERNAVTGNRVNDSEEKGLRGRLLFTPSDVVDVHVIGFVSNMQRRCCVAEQLDPTGPFGIATTGFLAASEALGFPFMNYDDGDRRVYAADEGDDETDTRGGSVQVDWELAGGHVLTSITGYQHWDNLAHISNAALPQPVINVSQNQVNKVLSQELRVASATGGVWEYIAGLYAYAQDTTFNTATTAMVGANRVFPLPAAVCAAPCRMVPGTTAFQDFDQETRSIAAFGNVTRYLTEAWDVTLGLRYGIDRKDATINHYNSPGAAPPFPVVFPTNMIGDRDRRDRNVTWSANTRYAFTNDIMGFASVATGFKSGGFNATRVAVGVPIEFQEEQSISYELGLKSRWLDRRLQLNATLYWTDLEDFQEATLNPQTNTGFIVANAGDRRARGIEGDMTWQVVPAVTLSGTLAYLDAEYTSYPNAQCGVGETPTGTGNSCDRRGQTPAFSPKWTYSLGGEWVAPLAGSGLELRTRADWAWIARQNLIRDTLDAPGIEDAYGLLSLRTALGSDTGRWEVIAFVDNALDETYFVSKAGQPGAGLISGGGVAPARGFVGWYGRPRTWGLQLNWRMN
jgi:iron complex outermembrane recepter protein